MKIENVYQHNGTGNIVDFAKKIATDYDLREISEPFSIVDLDNVKRQMDLWKFALPSVGPYYAVKCNSDLNILKTLSANGACFDCASVVEMDKILGNGLASGEEIILAHPIKSRECIRYAVENDVTMMTFDSIEELRKIVSITTKAKIRVEGFEALVDLNKKFGADIVTSKLIFHEAAKLGVEIHGISFHIGSGVDNCRPMAGTLQTARTLLDYGRLLGHPVQILDIGGGFLPTNDRSFLKTGHFIENTLSTCFEGITLAVIAEPGRFLVTNAQYVATRVNQKREGYMRADIWGPTCCSFDIIETDRYLPAVREGDWILYPGCGAYSICLSTHFNGFSPPNILYVASRKNWRNIEENLRNERHKEADEVPQRTLSKI
ncbi:hypothetical protein RB195_012980 [Necator americanus]|uniref:ornithine decarboxylase n=1 Tax=Necator americanus TaxID=51031 RepID=A0ABR1DTG8_NECAM